MLPGGGDEEEEEEEEGGWGVNRLSSCGSTGQFRPKTEDEQGKVSVARVRRGYPLRAYV